MKENEFQEPPNNEEGIMATDLPDVLSVQEKKSVTGGENDAVSLIRKDTNDKDQQSPDNLSAQSTQTDSMNERNKEDQQNSVGEKQHQSKGQNSSTDHLSSEHCKHTPVLNATNNNSNQCSHDKGYSSTGANKFFLVHTDQIADSRTNASYDIPEQCYIINGGNNEEVYVKMEPDPDDLEYAQAKQTTKVGIDSTIGNAQLTQTSPTYEQSPDEEEGISSRGAYLLTTFKMEVPDEIYDKVDGNSSVESSKNPVSNFLVDRNSVSTPEDGSEADISDMDDLEDTSHITSGGENLTGEVRLSNHLMFEIIGSNHDEESSGPITCTYCSKYFSEPDDLVRHMSEHAEKTEDNKYKCKICSRLFKKRSSAGLHAMVHLDRKHFPCTSCSKVFRTRRALLTHIQLCHSDKKVEIICKVCSTTFKSRKALKNHKISQHDNFKFTCRMCYIQFTDDKTLADHVCEKKTVKLHVCPVCSKSFNRGLSLKEHMWIHTDETKFHKPFMCENCPMCFRKKSHLDEHRRTHTGERPFQCTSCPRAFSSKNALKRHLVIHTGVKPLLCDVCSRSFASLGDFNVHKKIHTGEKPHSCHICYKKFRRKGDLTEHIRTHTGEKPFECKICSKTYRRSQHLTDHLRTHSGEKPHICVVCSKAFITSKELKRHISTHTQSQNVQTLSSEKLQEILSGQLSPEALKDALDVQNGVCNIEILNSLQNEKPFKCETCWRSYRTQNALNRHTCTFEVEEKGEVICDVCSKICSSSKALKRHMRSHRYVKDLFCPTCSAICSTRAELSEHMKTHNVREHICEVCSKTFKKASHLKRHSLIHSEEKPFSCDKCSMKFRRKERLKEHERTHTGETPFSCEVCLKTFTRKIRLQKHFKQFHGSKTALKCNMCLEEFEQLSELKEHRLNHLDKGRSEKRHVEVLEENPTALEMLQNSSSSETEEWEPSDYQQEVKNSDPDWVSDDTYRSDSDQSEVQLDKSDTIPYDESVNGDVDQTNNSDANGSNSESENMDMSHESENMDMSHEESGNSNCSENLAVAPEVTSDKDVNEDQTMVHT